MLVLRVQTSELYNEETSEFLAGSDFRLELEHSLVSVSKWESVWKKPFLSSKEKTTEETLSYITMMIHGDELQPQALKMLFEQHLEKIKNYIEDPMTATTIAESKAARAQKIITAEVIYSWIAAMHIPIEAQHWHLNKLITLIRVIAAENAPKTKMSAADRRELNRQRLAKYNTRG